MYKFGSAVIKPAGSAGGRDVFIIEKKNKKKKKQDRKNERGQL